MLLPWLKNYDLLIFDQIDSTNSEALRLAKTGVKGNFVIVAREQTDGKGRKGKLWESISGNLHMSILLRPMVDMCRIKELSFLTAVTLYEVIQEFANKLTAHKADIKLKWPNDVLVGGKKIAGILLESTCLSSVNCVIIGIGVNTHFIPDISDVALTSLFNEGIILKSSDNLLSNFMDKFQIHYSGWEAEDSFDSIRKKWLKLAYNLNSNVTLDNGVQKVSGVFRSIDQEGAICIELADGKLCSFASGQVTYR